jgi:tetratricopeptide (TPR) repeat protein
VALPPANIHACLNDYEHRTPDPGTPAATAKEYIGRLRHHPEVEAAELTAKAEQANSGKFQDISDYAVVLLREGEYRKGLGLLEKLALDHGEEYIIAANLGTAYELTGDVPNALKWIRKGNELNPDSHGGTEWLHVKILEAKLKAQEDKEWFSKNTTLDLDFGREAKPELPKNLLRDEKQNELSLEQVRKALEYQLHERTQFIQSDDPQMSELLISLGNILVLQAEPENAHEVFKLAREYENVSSPLLEAKIKTYNPLQGNMLEKFLWNLTNNTLLTLLGIAAISAIGWYVYSNFLSKKVAV